MTTMIRRLPAAPAGVGSDHAHDVGPTSRPVTLTGIR